MCSALDIAATIFIRIGIGMLLYAPVAAYIIADWNEQHTNRRRG